MKTGEVRLDSNLLINSGGIANFLKLVCRHFNLKFVKTGEVRLDSNLLINSGGILKFKIR